MLLSADRLNVYYGTIHAVKDVSFDVAEGEIVTLIGANGAGKTTVMQTLSGLLSPRSGEVRYNGQRLTGTPPHRILRSGIAHVPEGRRIFTQLSVADNLRLGAFSRPDRKEVEESLAGAYTRFPILGERRDQMAGTLSGGEQQMLAMARALMSKPRLLLLDEPSMGLSPILVEQVFRLIREVNAAGTTILVVEQNALQALRCASRGYVLSTGRVVLSGPSADLLADANVRRAYLGG